METLVINGLRFTDKANLGFLSCKDEKNGNGIYFFYYHLKMSKVLNLNNLNLNTNWLNLREKRYN